MNTVAYISAILSLVIYIMATFAGSEEQKRRWRYDTIYLVLAAIAVCLIEIAFGG